MADEEENLNLPTITTGDLIDISALNKDTTSTVQQIIDEKNPDHTKQLIDQFNLNIAKKTTIRVMKTNGVLDTVLARIEERLDKESDKIPTGELVQYLKVVQDALEKMGKSLELVKNTPTIVINDNSQNLNVSTSDGNEKWSRESRQKIMDAVRAAMGLIKENKVTDIEDGEEEETIEPGRTIEDEEQ